MSPEASPSGRPFLSLLPAVVFLCVLLCLGISPAFSATFTVTNTNDSGAGSLRQAILDANSAGGADTIAFSTTGTITLTSGTTLNVTDDLTITGPSGGIIIDGNNLGSVITITSGTVSISNLTVTKGKITAGEGGGLRVLGGSLTLSKCTISGNSASGALVRGAGIGNSGTLTMTDCTVSGNTSSNDWGGGIYNTGTLTMTNCTLSGNEATASYGGGIYVSGTVTMTNCTVSGNKATSGGGIYNWQSLTLLNCTITKNTATGGNGGGFDNESAAGASVKNTIISGNTGTTDVYDGGSSPITSNGYNLVGNSPNNQGSVFSATGDIVSTSPGLDSLADNGGSTQTHKLQSGSAAIDKGTNTGAPSTDQRGENRPKDGDGDGTATTDIGAYELAASASTSNTPPAAHAQHVSCGQAAGSTVSITLSGSDQEGDTLTYWIVKNPSAGTLSGVATDGKSPNVTYTWNGGSTTDSFTFRVNDGNNYSAPATVKVEAVTGPSNMPAIPHRQVVTTASGSGVSITLSGSDFNGDTITYDHRTAPAHGTLSGTTPNLTYTPDSGYSGADAFYFKAKDGRTDIPRDSEPAWVYIYVGTLSVPSLPPVADAGSDGKCNCDATSFVELDGSRSFDPAGRTLTYSWSSGESPNSVKTKVKAPADCKSVTVTLTVTNTDSQSATDSATVTPQAVSPAYDTLRLILLALFCAFVGVRYIRRGATQKR